MATVNEIDLENGTLRLEGENVIKEYVAHDPENLKKAKVGGYVVAAYTAVVGLELQEVPAENWSIGMFMLYDKCV